MSTVPAAGSTPPSSAIWRAQALRDRDAARVDADEREPVELGVPLDDLVGDPPERPRHRVLVEQDLLGRVSAGWRKDSPFRPHGTGLKDEARGTSKRKLGRRRRETSLVADELLALGGEQRPEGRERSQRQDREHGEARPATR